MARGRASDRSRTPTVITSSTSRWRPPASPRTIAAQAIAITDGVLDALDYIGILCIEFFVTRDGRLLDQRAGAATAQLRAPDVRRVPDQPVRAAAARDLRAAARVARAAAARGHGQPARRSLAGRRARLGGRPRVSRRQTAPVRKVDAHAPAARWDTSPRSRRPARGQSPRRRRARGAQKRVGKSLPGTARANRRLSAAPR